MKTIDLFLFPEIEAVERLGGDISDDGGRTWFWWWKIAKQIIEINIKTNKN